MIRRLIAILLALFMGLALAHASADAGLCGGWMTPEDALVPQEALAALDKALEGLTGTAIEPVALLGTQVVAGLNYCLLCRVTPFVPDAQAYYALVYVYAAPDGTAELTQITALDIAALSEQSAE